MPTRAALCDLSNWPVPDGESKDCKPFSQKENKRVDKKESKENKDIRKLSTKTVIPKLSKRRRSVLGSGGKEANEKSEWDELESIIKLYVLDATQSSRALSILSSLRRNSNGINTTEIPRKSNSSQDSEQGKHVDNVEPTRHCGSDCESTRRSRNDVVEPKHSSVADPYPDGIRFEQAIIAVNQQKEALRQEYALNRLKNELTEDVNQFESSSAYNNSNVLHCHTIDQGDGGQYLSDEDHSEGLCIIHWDSHADRPIVAIPNESSASNECSSQRDLSTVSPLSEDNKRHHDNIFLSNSEPEARKSPRKERDESPSQQFQNVDASQIKHESSGDDHTKRLSSDNEGVSMFDEDDMGQGVGIVHMDDELSVVAHEDMKTSSVSINSDQNEIATSPRAKRRNRRASICADLPARVTRSRRKKIDKVIYDNSQNMQIDTKDKDTSSHENESNSSIQNDDINHTENPSTPCKDRESVSSCSTIDAEKFCNQDECVDEKIVNLILTGNHTTIEMLQDDNITPEFVLELKTRINSLPGKEGENESCSVGFITLHLALAVVKFFRPMYENSFGFIDPLLVTLRSTPEQSVSNVHQDQKPSIRFQEQGIPSTACISPPNDRQPGSATKFENYAKTLIRLISALDNVVGCSDINKELLTILNDLVRALALLSSNNVIVKSLLDAAFSPEHFQAPSHRDVASMASMLCTELSIRMFTRHIPESLIESEETGIKNFSLAPSSVQLDKSLHGHQYRSVLRHRMSWVLTSVIRYYLRWLFDEAPTRARMVLLSGDYPTISCRSTFREHYQLVPPSPTASLKGKLQLSATKKSSKRRGRRDSLCPKKTLSSSNVLDIGFSSVFVQALDQIFHAFSMCCASLEGMTCCSNEEECARRFHQSLFSEEVLLSTARRMPSWISEEWSRLCGFDAEDSLDDLRRQLQFAQTVVAAEQARKFLSEVMGRVLIRQIGEISGVWDKIEYFSGMLLRQGLREDSHFALLSNMKDFESMLEEPYMEPLGLTQLVGNTPMGPELLIGLAVDPLNALTHIRKAKYSENRKVKTTQAEKEVIQEMEEASTFIFDFPELESTGCEVEESLCGYPSGYIAESSVSGAFDM